MYDVKVLGQGIISITGDNAQVIRLKREQIPQLKLGSAKGIYILWGKLAVYKNIENIWNIY